MKLPSPKSHFKSWQDLYKRYFCHPQKYFFLKAAFPLHHDLDNLTNYGSCRCKHNIVSYLIFICITESSWLEKKWTLNCIIYDTRCFIATSILKDVLGGWTTFFKDEALGNVSLTSIISSGNIIGVDSKLVSFFFAMRITSYNVSIFHFTC